jgi:hypothetical protein
MLSTVRSITVGTAAMLTSIVEGMLSNMFSGDMSRVLIPGIVAGLAGGVAAAVLPLGRDKTWGYSAGLKSILIGIIVGSFCSLFLADVTVISANQKHVLVGIASFLGQKILDQINKAGPGLLVEWLLRKQPSNPNTPKPPEQT